MGIQDNTTHNTQTLKVSNGTQPRQKQTILIVDDTPTNLGVVNEHLRSVGYRTLVASSGEAALTRARRGQPDLILLDVLMPGLNGFETCQRLKSLPETSHIPVIFMTALTETEDKVRGFQSGAVDYITKPIQFEELLARVSTHLKITELTHRLEMTVEERTQDLQMSLDREQNLSGQLQSALDRSQALADQLRVALDRETELVRMKTRVLNVVSHEFRTPLCVISTSAHMLAKNGNKLPPDKKQSTQHRISEAVKYLTELLDASLQANEVYEPGLTANPIPVDFPKFCEMYITGIEGLSDSPINESYKGFDEDIQVDVPLIRRIISNLLNNAQKFTQDGSPIDFEASLVNNMLVIKVTDEGIGIPIHEQEEVFQPLSRANNTSNIPGLGLGLSIVANAVEVMGGNLSLRSEGEGKGCCFTVMIPMVGQEGESLLNPEPTAVDDEQNAADSQSDSDTPDDSDKLYSLPVSETTHHLINV